MRKSILVVEDDEAIAKNLELLLEGEGFSVAIAKNGQLGLDHLKNQVALPSLILLDLMMPVMDGWAFRKAQDSEPILASIPVVIMTADGQIEAKRTRAGAAGFIKKPFDIDDLLNTVERFTS